MKASIIDRPDEDLLRTAIHEAGHAVVAARKGFEIGGASIVPDHERGTWGHALIKPHEDYDSESKAAEHIMVLAGGYAALIALGYDHDIAVSGTGGDFEEAEEIITGWGLPSLEYWLTKTVYFISCDENRRAVGRLSDYLFKMKEIDWESIVVLLEVSDGETTEAEFETWLQIRKSLY